MFIPVQSSSSSWFSLCCSSSLPGDLTITIMTRPMGVIAQQVKRFVEMDVTEIAREDHTTIIALCAEFWGPTVNHVNCHK